MYNGVSGSKPHFFKKNFYLFISFINIIYILLYRQVKVLSSQQRISPEGSQTDSQPKLEGQILYTVNVGSNPAQGITSFSFN